MTVHVTRRDGATDDYFRFGDAYIKNHDGTLDVVRTGAKQAYSYAAGQWTDVQGDQKRFKRRGFRAR
jgi:hypothetical protein